MSKRKLKNQLVLVQKLQRQRYFYPKKISYHSKFSKIQAQIPKQEHVEIMKEPEVAANWQQYQVQYHDILSAISYMLTQEIPRKPIITGDNMVTLKEWIHVLRQFSPGTAPLKRLFYRLDEWLQKRELSMTAEEWIEKVDEINVRNFFLMPSTACKIFQLLLKNNFLNFNKNIYFRLNLDTPYYPKSTGQLVKALSHISEGIPVVCGHCCIP